MKRPFVFLATVVVAADLAGCSQGPASIGTKSRAFDGAAATVKESWHIAVACAQTNDYAGAATRLFWLRTQLLTREQAAAVDASLKTVTEALYAAADRGDPAAQKAIEELKKRPRR